MNPNEPRPQCPECGRILRPKDSVIVVSDDDERDIPDAMPDIHYHPDVFAGLYCSGDCILDAIARGWPEYRNMTE